MWISRVPSASNPGDGPSRGDITFVEALGAVRDQCMCPILDVVLQDLWLKRKVDVRLGMFWGWCMWKICLSGDVALSHLFGMVMIRWVSQLETWLETENDFCEWDRLEHECQFWASLAGYRMSCPTWQKEGERDVHFWDFVCTCCFALWCHLMCYMFGLCCALYSPVLVLAWRIHDISPCYGGLPPRLL